MVSEKKIRSNTKKRRKSSYSHTKIRSYEWRKRESIKKRIIKLYFELENLPEAQLNKIFLDEYVEKIFKISEIAFSYAKWKLGKADIKILQLKKIQNLKTKKVEQRWCAPFDMGVTKEGELITKFDNIKKTNPRRESIVRDHFTKMREIYYPLAEIKIHNQLKLEYGRPLNVMVKLRKMKSRIHSVEREIKNLIDFIEKEGLKEKYDSEENQKYEDEIINIMKKI